MIVATMKNSAAYVINSVRALSPVQNQDPAHQSRILQELVQMINFTRRQFKPKKFFRYDVRRHSDVVTENLDLLAAQVAGVGQLGSINGLAARQ